MPRYIDEDKLSEYFEERHKNLCRNYGETDHYCQGYEDAMLVVKKAPTEDVVPRSEVDNLIRHIIINEDIAIKCKRENGEQNEEYWKGKISAFRQIRSYIDADLKKKYIGENNG